MFATGSNLLTAYGSDWRDTISRQFRSMYWTLTTDWNWKKTPYPASYSVLLSCLSYIDLATGSNSTNQSLSMYGDPANRLRLISWVEMSWVELRWVELSCKVRANAVYRFKISCDMNLSYTLGRQNATLILALVLGCLSTFGEVCHPWSLEGLPHIWDIGRPLLKTSPLPQMPILTMFWGLERLCS